MKAASTTRSVGYTKLKKDGVLTLLLKSRLRTEFVLPSSGVLVNALMLLVKRVNLYSAETSGLCKIVSPAGLATTAVASSATATKAPPMPSARAPGLLKLNWKPPNVSLLTRPAPPAPAGPVPQANQAAIRRSPQAAKRLIRALRTTNYHIYLLGIPGRSHSKIWYFPRSTMTLIPPSGPP